MLRGEGHCNTNKCLLMRDLKYFSVPKTRLGRQISKRTDLLSLRLSITFPPPKEDDHDMKFKERDMHHNWCKCFINEKSDKHDTLKAKCFINIKVLIIKHINKISG